MLLYTEPFGLNKLLELNYAYTNNQNTSDREVNNYNTGSGKYDEPNLRLTNNFENTFLAHRIGANFRVQEKNTITSLVLVYRPLHWKVRLPGVYR
ncbi:MAG: hypothetical protein IPF69_00575 [Chitinophagaceae bacterium]|nr:hypothetical protein [Chitinophagaceae bacterium]